MNIVMDGPALMLGRLQRVKLIDASGSVAEVRRGKVWITLQDDSRDVFIREGESWTIDRDGLTLLQAEEPSTVLLREKARASTLSSRVVHLLGAACHAAADWLARRQWPAAPYY